MTEEQARNHPEVLSGKRVARRDTRLVGGWSTCDPIKRRLYVARYRRTLKGKATLSRINYRQRLLNDNRIAYFLDYNQRRKGLHV